MPDIVRMLVVLTAICVISALTLSFIEQATRDPIAYQRLKFVKGPAVSSLLEGFDNDPIADLVADVPCMSPSNTPIHVTFFPGKKDGRLSAVAFEMAKTGYHGEVTTMMAIDIDTRKLLGIRIIQHTETPGLGARITEEPFYTQFAGLGADQLRLTADGGKVAAISGASISSAAVTTSAREGIELLEKNLETIQQAVAGS